MACPEGYIRWVGSNMRPDTPRVDTPNTYFYERIGTRRLYVMESDGRLRESICNISNINDTWRPDPPDWPLTLALPEGL